MRCRGNASSLPRLSLLLSLFGAVSPLQLAFANWVTEPRGPAATGIAQLSWVLFIVALIVVVIVLALYLFALTSEGAPRGTTPSWSTPFVVIGGIVVPTFILISVLTYSLGKTSALQEVGEGEPITIEVVGNQWWWEVRYPEEGVVTANELRIPVGVPVRLELTSDDVIHSFWVPTLNGKMDLVPGRTNTLIIEAEEVGLYRGSCAEYCGTQHAKMNLLVLAEPRETFEGWLADQRRSAALPDTPLEREGLEVFLSSACVYCHTIEGTNATGDLGPDLTHLASRLTLGAGTIANNRGNLAGWIVNSQALKPGNRMPPMYLEADDLQALLAYLGSLE
ncbi:MAG TPA: cytochrome c oxidase subunit II [Trueperaceae bacterium]